MMGAPYPAATTGVAYVFRRGKESWGQEARLLAPDGQPHDIFGGSVDVSGDRVMIGAPGSIFVQPPGSAYLFHRNDNKWSFDERFAAFGGSPYDQFGHGVAISGNKAVIGVPTDDFAGFVNAGSAVTVVLGANAVVKMRAPGTPVLG